MNTLIPVPILLLIASVLLNIYLIVLIRKKPLKKQSKELQEFLADLMGGIGMVAVTRVDPNSIILRSPRR